MASVSARTYPHNCALSQQNQAYDVATSELG